MDNSPKGRRMHSLTADTSNALHQTLSGLVALSKYKLDVGFKYVLPGKDQSDRIEAEFGIYRQSSGGNYCISTYQVYMISHINGVFKVNIARKCVFPTLGAVPGD